MAISQARLPVLVEKKKLVLLPYGFHAGPGHDSRMRGGEFGKAMYV